jgi:hypothetical protein
MEGSSNLEEPAMDEFGIRVVSGPWNKGKLIGQKAPFKLKEIGLSVCGFRSFAEHWNWNR